MHDAVIFFFLVRAFSSDKMNKKEEKEGIKLFRLKHLAYLFSYYFTSAVCRKVYE